MQKMTCKEISNKTTHREKSKPVCKTLTKNYGGRWFSNKDNFLLCGGILQFTFHFFHEIAEMQVEFYS